MKKKKKTKSKKDRILTETKKLFEEMVMLFPHDCVYSFFSMKEEENGDGGHFAILYCPSTRKIDFYIYESLYKEVPDLNEKQLLWLKYTIAHEIGHLFVWELAEMTHKKYNQDLTEKAASDIAFLLVELHDKRYGKKH